MKRNHLTPLYYSILYTLKLFKSLPALCVHNSFIPSVHHSLSLSVYHCVSVLLHHTATACIRNTKSLCFCGSNNFQNTTIILKRLQQRATQDMHGKTKSSRAKQRKTEKVQAKCAEERNTFP